MLDPITHQPKLAAKKFQINQSERPLFDTIVTQLGMPQQASYPSILVARHPLAFLVEAADDICYNIIDIEDAYKLKMCSYTDAMQYFHSVIHPSQQISINELDTMGMTRDQKISKLRALAIGSLIKACSQVFLENQVAILSGTFQHALIDVCELADAVADIKQFSQQELYEHRKKLSLELAGYQIIGGLLDAFVGAAVEFYHCSQGMDLAHPDVIRQHQKRLSKRSQKLLKLMNFPFKRDAVDPENDEQVRYGTFLTLDKYTLVQKATDYVSGMTDEFARVTYQQLTGTGI